jgi:hypothetical protein
MKSALYLSLIFIFSTCKYRGILISYYKTNSKKLYWSQDSLLSIDNFKRKKMKDIDANSVTSIEYSLYEKDSTLLFEINTVFYTKLSTWNTLATDNYEALLRHENIHFAITELFARKFRKFYIDSFDVLIREGQFNTSMFNKYINKIAIVGVKKEQQIYDKETQHGTETTKQEEWEVRIINELRQYQDYSSTLITRRRANL